MTFLGGPAAHQDVSFDRSQLGNTAHGRGVNGYRFLRSKLLKLA